MSGADVLTELDREHSVLPQIVRRCALDRSDETAVISVGEGSVTWSVLHEHVLLWADAIRRLGVEAGEPVITMIPTGLDALHAYVGCGWNRAIEVPVNTSYTGEWLTRIADNSGATRAIIASRYLPQVLGIVDAISIDTIVVLDAARGDLPSPPAGVDLIDREQFLEGASPIDDHDGPAPWDVSCIVYTSGTTGRSKGVAKHWGKMVPGEGVLVPARLMKGDRYYAPFPGYHLTGKAALSLAAVYDGSIVIRERFSTEQFWSDVREHGCTGTLLVGAMANFIHRQEPSPLDGDNPLNYVVMAPVIPEVDAFKSRFGVEVFTAYSMTELNVPIVSWDREVTSQNYRSAGRVRRGVEVRVVDEHDYEVGPNTIGELIVRGTGEPWSLYPVYWRMPEATVEAWRNGWFHTGDAFTYDEDGEFYFVDRFSDSIRRRGENISSFEVEGAVNSHPAVLESAAVAVPSEWGEDEVKIAVVPKPGHEIVPAELLEFLTPRMPRFALPRYVEVLDALPKTPTERVQKVKIREAGITAATWDREAVPIPARES